ncbi:hypothetical protein TNIN_363471 [Trichonephila inaurata madagascariensis]|uniref:Uncharacterized protein n=1 Tax=Trichonephila inaurata madagascariensis TaxID=2747483 RepID=A0A8X6WYS1_9ARAC|nr:hypothetical protein TNIN_363471 [Trichonephila inaurata madagascariensis]
MQKKLNSCGVIGAKEHSEINRRSVLAMRMYRLRFIGVKYILYYYVIAKTCISKAYDSINKKCKMWETLANASMSDAALKEKFSMEHVTAFAVSGMAHGNFVDIHHFLGVAR